jgi:hypothetical protein
MPPVSCPAFRGMMGRGIEGTKIFRNKKDRDDSLSRVGKLCLDGKLVV